MMIIIIIRIIRIIIIVIIRRCRISKRVSDQRLAELEYLLAQQGGGGRQSGKVGYGLVDPYAM